jgi:L-glutamine-phosphate cytidylyltransferase
MKAIILSAGRGKRLLPLTQKLPKCLLPVGGRSVLAWQLWALEAAGVDEAVVVTGFGASRVEWAIRSRRPKKLAVRTCFNPLFDRADNLVSCLAARDEMREDFLLLNGDTLIEPDIVRRMLASANVLVSAAVVHKPSYDADDMKVRSGLGWLDHIGKDLALASVDGEAIGVSLFRGDGPRVFEEALEHVLAQPDGERRWYLSAVELLAQRGLVRTVAMDGLDYAEIDYHDDLARAEALVSNWNTPRPPIEAPQRVAMRR